MRPQLNPSRLMVLVLERVPRGAAEPFVGAIRGASDEQLRRAMVLAPVRRAILEAVFRQMPRYLDARRAENVRLRVRWRITVPGASNTEVYELDVDGGRASVRHGPSESGRADVTITVGATTFLRLVTGAADPMRAYLDGQLAGNGDIMAAARMASLFRIPGKSPRKQNANT